MLLINLLFLNTFTKYLDVYVTKKLYEVTFFNRQLTFVAFFYVIIVDYFMIISYGPLVRHVILRWIGVEQMLSHVPERTSKVLTSAQITRNAGFTNTDCVVINQKFICFGQPFKDELDRMFFISRIEVYLFIPKCIKN